MINWSRRPFFLQNKSLTADLVVFYTARIMFLSRPAQRVAYYPIDSINSVLQPNSLSDSKKERNAVCSNNCLYI